MVRNRHRRAARVFRSLLADNAADGAGKRSPGYDESEGERQQAPTHQNLSIANNPRMRSQWRVKDNLYVIEGTNPRPNRALFTGGTIGVFITDAGVVLVDTKLADYGGQILDRIRKVTNKPCFRATAR